MDPFANALQASQKPRIQQQSGKNISPEIEDNLLSSSKNPNFANNQALNPFSEALARTAGANKFDGANFSQNQNISPLEQKRQEMEAERLRKKEALKLKLHKEINPVDLTDLYNAHEERTKKALEDLRHELRMFVNEIKDFYKEVDIATFNHVTNQGQEGVGLRSYYEKLRTFIQLLRKKVHSAKTWLQTSSAKNKKKKARKGGAGIEISNKGPEQTADIFDQMHHEQSTAYSGN